MEADRQVMSTGKPLTIEEDVPVESASRTFLSSRPASRDHRGEVVYGIATDITERKRAEEALHEVREAERSRIARDLHDMMLQDLTYAMRTVQSSETTTRTMVEIYRTGRGLGGSLAVGPWAARRRLRPAPGSGEGRAVLAFGGVPGGAEPEDEPGARGRA